MPAFGFTTTPKPTRVDELLDSDLMSKLDQVDVMSRKIFAGKLQGERRSKKRGVSVEFADYRHYVHGDDLRFVDWNIYARLDRLFLKMFIEEEDLSLLIAIDSSASMNWGNPSKFVFCQRLAMALGYIGLANHNRVTLYGFDSGGVKPLPNLRGRRRTQEMGRWLVDLESGGASAFSDAMRSIALARQGKGVMIILSDFMFKEGYEKGLRYLAGGGYDTFCLQILAPEEVDPAKHGMAGDLRLTDIEDEDVAEVTVSAALLKRYKENLNAYCGKLRDFCVRRGMMHLSIESNTDMTTLLMEYLRKRGLLK
ncbi:MAG: DUF58 domain-containing protein [Phycisphaerales bacterium]|nr:DUF58 domain-containing protein [Phycisphaerales bacterium]MCI0629139.1 DUF58 domain-containing protein [Phycisphaerales bacterium]MCI0676170.1 DUF58 domain-containing protein [Phycisphaerales bacterium]